MKKTKMITTTLPVVLLITVVGCSSSSTNEATNELPTPVLVKDLASDDLASIENHAGLKHKLAERSLAHQPAVNAAQVVSQPVLVQSDRVQTDQVQSDYVQHDAAINRENYQSIENNSITVTQLTPTSTFSVDVDTGSYSNMRRFINSGTLPPADAVRVEEFINYHSYNYPVPSNTDVPFSINTEITANPWNPKTHVLKIGLKAFEIEPEERPAANLVFLIDVSGSMSDKNKLGLVKPALKMLAKQLTERDTLSIAAYAGASGVVLEPTTGNQTRKIVSAIDGLRPSGSTNGRAGIELAYALAAENFKEDSINRVVLVTDGDFNVGVSSVELLKTLIEDKRRSGIQLTTLGFGTGNYNDHLMEQLADVGNGNYSYIDTLNEARKVLVDEAGSTLFTVAKDVKIQVEFNPAVVSEYRLIGYENRVLANEDFSNDKVDAGDIGAGHSVTALYEVALVGEGGERNSALRYQSVVPTNVDFLGNDLSEIAEVRLRYKLPDSDESQLLTQVIARDEVVEELTKASSDLRFATAVAAFAQSLRGGKYLNDFSDDDLLQLAMNARGDDPFGYRQEFINLIRLAEELDGSALQSELQLGPDGVRKTPRG